MFCKILNGRENVNPNRFFFKIKTCKRTRGHYFTLEKDQSRLNSRKCAFSNQRSNDHKQVELSFS